MTKVSLTCKKAGVLTRLEELTESIEQMYQSTFEAFIYHNKGALKVVEEKGLRVDDIAGEVANHLLTIDYEEEGFDRQAVLELVKALGQIKASAIEINDSVAGKIREAVLFSDKAVTELKDVFEVVFECLHNLRDLVLTGNSVIAKHLVDRTSLYSEVINEYSMEHEERLIKGICLPKSSIIYLTMLDALKNVLRNIKAIGELFNIK